MSELQRLARVGVALSTEPDIAKLLELIVDEARSFTGADAGTLYTVDEEKSQLKFEILQNDTLKIRMGGTSGVDSNLPPVSLEVSGNPNHANVSSYVALTHQVVNIPDLYEAEGFDFSGARAYDESTGYRSKSIVVIPLENHENDVIGVLQLINAKDPETGGIVAFESSSVDLVASLASQAAVALTNTRLIQETKRLLDAFIRSIATAIDEKSPYTGGHIRRVTELTMMIARRINEVKEGPLADAHFTEEELEELHIAAWLHDIGKIVLPEYVVDKKTKLETVFDRAGLLEARFGVIRQARRNSYLEERVRLLESGETDEARLKVLEADLKRDLEGIESDHAFLIQCNQPTEFMSDERLQRLGEIAKKTYGVEGTEARYLTEEESLTLSIRRGTLTGHERQIIENHAVMSIRMLSELPFPKKLSRVPEYAGAHHERLDGSGYPLGLTEEELSIQARIIAIADIFEALSARDRPYRKPSPLPEVIKILGRLRDDRHIDPDLYKLLVETDLYQQYADRFLKDEPAGK